MSTLKNPRLVAVLGFALGVSFFLPWTTIGFDQKISQYGVLTYRIIERVPEYVLVLPFPILGLLLAVVTLSRNAIMPNLTLFVGAYPIALLMFAFVTKRGWGDFTIWTFYRGTQVGIFVMLGAASFLVLIGFLARRRAGD
jgi:hypothetical protein